MKFLKLLVLIPIGLLILSFEEIVSKVIPVKFRLTELILDLREKI